MQTFLGAVRTGVVRLAAAAIVVIALAPMALAGVEVNTDKGGVAIHGYDPVAYFTEEAPVEGDPAYTASYEGATYHFASAENRDRFEADPAAYAPAYGGYCAFGVSVGRKFDVDPTAWKVVDGTLYLNLNHDVQRRWSQDVPGHIARADDQWPQIVDKSDEELAESF